MREREDGERQRRMNCRKESGTEEREGEERGMEKEGRNGEKEERDGERDRGKDG